MSKRKTRSRRPPNATPPKMGGTPQMIAARRQIDQEAFLEHYRVAGSITATAKLAGIHRDSHYEWLKTDPTYPERFKSAEKDAVDLLVTEARRRGFIGIDKPVFYKGQKVATVKEYSDVLLMFLLNGLRPEVFRPRVEHTGKNGGPIQHAHVVAPVALHELNDEELAVAERLQARIEAAKAQAIPVQSAHA